GHGAALARAAGANLEAAGIEDEGGPDGEGVFPLFRGKAGERRQGLRALAPEKQKLLLTDSISPLPLHKVLVLLDCLKEAGETRYGGHELLALARALVYSISNLHFGPEVG